MLLCRKKNILPPGKSVSNQLFPGGGTEINLNCFHIYGSFLVLPPCGPVDS